MRGGIWHALKLFCFVKLIVQNVMQTRQLHSILGAQNGCKGCCEFCITLRENICMLSELLKGVKIKWYKDPRLVWITVWYFAYEAYKQCWVRLCVGSTVWKKNWFEPGLCVFHAWIESFTCNVYEYKSVETIPHYNHLPSSACAEYIPLNRSSFETQILVISIPSVILVHPAVTQ